MNNCLLLCTLFYRSESPSLGMMHLTKDPCLVIGKAVSPPPPHPSQNFKLDIMTKDFKKYMCPVCCYI